MTNSTNLTRNEFLSASVDCVHTSGVRSFRQKQQGREREVVQLRQGRASARLLGQLLGRAGTLEDLAVDLINQNKKQFKEILICFYFNVVKYAFLIKF